jgi:hypothetical protein
LGVHARCQLALKQSRISDGDVHATNRTRGEQHEQEQAPHRHVSQHKGLDFLNGFVIVSVPKEERRKEKITFKSMN